VRLNKRKEREKFYLKFLQQKKGRNGVMKKNLHQNSRNAKNPAEGFLKKRAEKFEEGDYESRKLKNLLRRAVEKEFAPQSLIDSIGQRIRREI
jgi:hypothetical protein